MTIEWVDAKGLSKKQILNKIIEEKFDFVIDTNQRNENFLQKKLHKLRIPYFYYPQFKRMEENRLQYCGKQMKEILNNFYPRKAVVLVYYESEE
ncbi:MAG: hypothetical protein APG08_01579 [Candidatus Methanofastidiosum methylothiophilum]|nr:MAG: hypothetical protein APG08_01579 [Candidatus Methanofastidiosum methylthiophilus]